MLTPTYIKYLNTLDKDDIVTTINDCYYKLETGSYSLSQSMTPAHRRLLKKEIADLEYFLKHLYTEQKHSY